MGDFFSPCFQLNRFVGLLEKHGEKTLTDGRFQKEREAWIAAVFLMGYSELTKQHWWLIQPDGIIPDILAISPYKVEGGWASERLNIEICEYEHHARANGLAEAIELKLKNTAYPQDYQLVCYVHHRAGESFTPSEITKQIKAISPRIRDIWVLASIQANHPADYVLARLYPELWVHPFNYQEFCTDMDQMDILQASRGKREEITFGMKMVELP
jgi:hypothetical protein